MIDNIFAYLLLIGLIALCIFLIRLFLKRLWMPESDKMEEIFIGIFTTSLFYLTVICMYLMELISALIILIALGASVIVLIGLLIYAKKKVGRSWAILLACGPLILAFWWEYPMVEYDKINQLAIVYRPTVSLSNTIETNVYMIPVGSLSARNPVEVEKLLAENGLTSNDILNELTVTSLSKYNFKNDKKTERIKKWLGVSDVDTSLKNVSTYLGTDTEGIEMVRSNENLSGNSAGLALTLSGLVELGKIKNEVPIAVTGAIDKDGNVLAIGSVQEKVRIAKRDGFKYIIIPKANANDAYMIQEKLGLEIEIIPVENVDEAVEYIEYLISIMQE